MGDKIDKIQRILTMQRRLLQGEVLCKPELAKEFGINERSVQRDIDDLRAYCMMKVPCMGMSSLSCMIKRGKAMYSAMENRLAYPSTN